jgi:hypothetical protein
MPGNMQGQPTPAATDIEHTLAGLKLQFRGEMPLLGALRRIERLVGAVELGAGILPVPIEEEFVEPAIQIVVVGDIGRGAGRQIAMAEDA